MKNIIGHGVLGLASSFTTTYLTFTNIEAGVRFLGELGGAVVMVLTIISMIRKMREHRD